MQSLFYSQVDYEVGTNVNANYLVYPANVSSTFVCNLIIFWSTAEHGHNSSITPCMIMKLTLMFKPATDLECIHT